MTGLMAKITLWGVLLAVFALGDISLLMVLPVDVPIIEKKTIRRNVDLVFDRCPHEYWVYYNKKESRLVVEFFGVHINAPSIEIKDGSIVSDLKVINNETLFALNKKNSQISMLMKDKWHFDSWIIRGKVLRIQLWVPLNPSRTLGKGKRSVLLPVVLISMVVVIMTAGLVVGLNRW
jgi:hypothetical protein